MPIVVFYKDKSIETRVADDIAESLAKLTAKMLDAKIEVRVVEPVSSYNSNEVHLEMRFRDFGEWSDEQLADYHAKAMSEIGKVLKDSKVSCSYSFYIIPTQTPRSMWAQAKTG